MKSGIYMWTCSANGKRYVGSAVDLRNRKSVHMSCLKAGDHHSVHFQRAFNKHGEAAFEFRVLLVCAPADLLMYEQRALDALKPELNISPTASSSLGIKRSEDFIRRLSEANKIAQNRPEIRVKKSAAAKLQFSDPAARAAQATRRRGKALSPEHVAKIAAANRGKKRASTGNMSAAQKRYWANLPHEEKRKKLESMVLPRRTSEHRIKTSDRTRMQWADRKAAGYDRL